MFPGPQARCRDHKACEARRIANVSIPPPSKASRVQITRHGVPYYFQKCNGVLPGTYPHLELTPDPKEATRFPPKEAKELAETWGARIVEF